MLRKYAAGSTLGSGARGRAIFGLCTGALVVGENGDCILLSPGDFKELFADPIDVWESLIEGLELLRPLVLENSPILSRLPFANR
jgi:hypothetical protein